MTEPKKYWLTDGQGNFALVASTDEHDRWVPLGWAETDEPTEGFVYVWRDGIAEPGPAPLAYFREVLSHNGWVPGPPPGGQHPAAPAEAAPDTSAKPSAAAPKSSKSATGGVEKE